MRIKRVFIEHWLFPAVSMTALLGGVLWFSLVPRMKQTDPAPSQEVHVCIVYSENYGINLAGLERLHSFDIHKYERIINQLFDDAVVDPSLVEEPAEISETDILRVHSKSFLQRLGKPSTVAQYLEAPVARLVPVSLLDSGVLEPFRFATGGTLHASRRALRHGIGINVGGGYHHAKPDKGEGFCIYADMPIAIRRLQADDKIRRALVIDLDVHQGNGTILCLDDDDTTFCFSIHQGDIYPIPKERGDLDVTVAEGTGDTAYLALLAEQLPTVFEQAGHVDIVFYQAGCDPLAGDPLASLDLSEQGIVKRDGMVIDACVKRGVPVVMTLGGGYGEDAWHAQYASIRAIVERYGQARPGKK